jgi:hypothetical protein
VKLKDEIDSFYEIFVILIKTLSLHVKKISNSILIIISSSSYFHQLFRINFFENLLSNLQTIQIFLIWKFVSFRQFRLNNRFRCHRFIMFEKDIKMIFLFEITRLKDSFEYQIWQKEMKNQLIFMNCWFYVEIENVELIDFVAFVLIFSVIFEKFRKIKINNFKIVMIMKNRLKCNDKIFLKNEINAKNAWKILKDSFSSFESKMLNDLLIKLWIIIFVNNQNVTNHVRRFKIIMQNIWKMIINVSINDNLFILYFI